MFQRLSSLDVIRRQCPSVNPPLVSTAAGVQMAGTATYVTALGPATVVPYVLMVSVSSSLLYVLCASVPII